MDLITQAKEMPKVCNRCAIEKPLTKFEKSGSGRRNTCKACRDKVKYNRIKADPIRWAKHLLCIKNRLKESRSRRREQHNEQARGYWHSRPNKAWSKAKKSAYDKTKYLENREKVIKFQAEYQRRHRLADTRQCQIRRLRNLTKESLRRNLVPKNMRTSQLLGATYDTIFQHLGPKPGAGFEYDHICPLNQALTKREIIALCHYTNLQWLSRKDNLAKGTKKTPLGEEMCQKLLNRGWNA